MLTSPEDMLTDRDRVTITQSVISQYALHSHHSLHATHWVSALHHWIPSVSTQAYSQPWWQLWEVQFTINQVYQKCEKTCSVKPSSHRLSCRRCELNWRQVKTVSNRKFWNWICVVFAVLSSVKMRRGLNFVSSDQVSKLQLGLWCSHRRWSWQNCSVFNILRTPENCQRLSPTLFTPPTRQHSLVLSASMVWTRHQDDQLVISSHQISQRSQSV